MSREEQVKGSSAPDAPDAQSEEDLRLQVNVRLRLEEIAELEAERLKRAARRQPTRKELCQLACRIYDARRARDRVLDRKLFGEPAWDMLLALYCLPARGERLGVTALTNAANAAGTTGLRWQTVLTKEGLIERGPPEVDARLQMVRLTHKGRELLETYLTRLYYCSTPVPPYPEKAGG